MSQSTGYRQVRLRAENVVMTIVVRDDPRLRAGRRLTLRNHEMGPEVRWTIEQVFDQVLARPRTDWAVGGIE